MGSTAQVRIKLLAPYCQSRSHETPKLNKELSDDYEKRTWRERLHVNEQDEVIIPGIALQNCIKEAAKFLSISIPGKGKSTFTKHFESGVSVIGDIETGVNKADVMPNRVFVPSNGIRGAGTRVHKNYPMLRPPLEFDVEFLIADDTITAEIFTEVLAQAGNLIGIGAFRVRNQGNCGRFKVESVKWHKLPEMSDAEKSKIIQYV
jgi:hypothetical protein